MMWDPAGKRAFRIYTLAYTLIVGILIVRRPTLVAPAVGAAALLWAMWWTGPLAPIAVLYFLGSCYALGRLVCPSAQNVLATTAGAAIWMLILWTSIHFPINYPWVYAIAFALPYFSLVARGARLNVPTFSTTRTEAAAFAILLFVLGAQFLAALKPEISSDGLSMHMALPAWVADFHSWPFDHTHRIWSLMPSGGDALYTGVYLLAGSMAAKLLNFAFLVLTCAMTVQLGLRWGSTSKAYLATALFASTPLVALVTASLFIENIWCALIVGSVLALVQDETRDNPLPATILASAALSVKLIAAAFAAPVLLIALLRGRGNWWRVALVGAALGLPVYVFAFVQSGNPIFPFFNKVFQSPDYYTFENFIDPTYGQPLSWKTAYEITFQSTKWIGGRPGAAGFHYFLLLLPALLLIRRRDRSREKAVALAVAAIGVLAVIFAAPNLRYMYAAMPLASLVLVWTPWTFLAPVLIALNLCYLPAAGYYDIEWALFKKSQIEPYILYKGPTLLLIDRLNREAPGEPAAFFSTDAITGFRGQAYLDSWHTEHFWEKARNQPDAAAIAAYVRSLGIRNVIAPHPPKAEFEVMQAFYDQFLEFVPDSQVGSLGLYRVRGGGIAPAKDNRPLAPGLHDDIVPPIQYTGSWLHDDQFAQASGHSVSYSEQTGDKLVLTFEGTAVTYVYTRALNRGVAEVWIDGALVRTLNQYSANTAWQSSTRFAGLAPGVHTFEVRVTGRKDPKSSGTHVDLDAVTVE
jgi:hypothetical protein